MEIWKDIKGFEGFYKVSSFGRIKRVATKFKCGSRWGKKRQIRFKEKILIPNTYPNGYTFVSLCTQKIKSRPMVHRVVAQHFIPNHFNKPQVNHKDGIKGNNNVKNLEWVTQSENMHHSFHVLKNQKVNNKKVFDSITNEVFFSIKKAAESKNISYPTLYAMLTGKFKNKTNLLLC